MTQLVTITMLKGEFIHPAWREAGTVCEVEQPIADRWIAHGSARLGGDLGEESPAAASELAGFPGAAQFEAAGITTLDQVKSLIADKGDNWPKSVRGITKPVAAAVSARLEELAAQ